jgi:hypothetical protein
MLLATYLNDHLAGSTAGLELARRARGANEGTALGASLADLTDEIDEDRDVLKRVMGTLGVRQDRAKVAVAWAGEKVGRLKLNGRLIGYSPLSRVVELEGLLLGVSGKAALWRMLRRLDHPQLESFDFDALTARAERQRDELERWRLEAGRDALSPTAT